MEEIHTTQLFDVRAMGALWAIRDTLDPAQSKMLDSLYKKRKDGNQAHITYKMVTSEPGQMGFGRFNGSIGAAINFERNIRGTLFNKYYWDVDVVNCHPTVLVQMMEDDGCESVYLKAYVRDRETIFTRLQTEYNLSREDTKDTIIKALYGSKPVTRAGEEDCPLLMNIFQEVRRYTTTLMQKPEYARLLAFARRQKDKSVYGSFLSWILFTEERKIMLAMREYMSRMGRSVDCLCHDGIMIRKLEDEMSFPDELLRGAEEFVASATTRTIRLLVKPWEVMTLPDAPAPSDGGESYEVLKERWENELGMFYFQPSDTICGLLDGTLIHYTYNHACNAFGNTFVLPDWRDNFFLKWMHDRDRRTILRIQLKPDERPDTYSLFRGFLHERSEHEETDVEPILAMFNELLDHVSNRDEEIKTYLLNWMAHMLQKPFENPGTCIIFSGRQGVGKDTLGNFIGNYLLGREYFANYDSADVFWSPYDQNKEGKFLMKLEEACGTDNKRHAASLKSRITAETVIVNPKGVKPYPVDNYARYVMTTNEGSPVHLEEANDRRIVLIRCGRYNQGNREFWNGIYKTLFNNVAGSVVGKWLMARDISTWEPREVPMTELKEMAAEQARSSEVTYLLDVWSGEETGALTLYNAYMTYCSENSMPYAPNTTAFGHKLLPLLRDGVIVKRRKAGGVVYSRP